MATGSGDWLPEKAEAERAVKVLGLHCFWINGTVFLKQGCHKEVSCFSVEPSGIIWYPSPSIVWIMDISNHIQPYIHYSNTVLHQLEMIFYLCVCHLGSFHNDSVNLVEDPAEALVL